jgi:hypothetical protein
MYLTLLLLSPSAEPQLQEPEFPREGGMHAAQLLLRRLEDKQGGLNVRLLRYGSDGLLSFLGDLGPINGAAKLIRELRKGIEAWFGHTEAQKREENIHEERMTAEQHRHLESMGSLELDRQKIKVDVLKVLLPQLSEDERKVTARRLLDGLVSDAIVVAENQHIDDIIMLPPHDEAA